jgi:hypothetical protein
MPLSCARCQMPLPGWELGRAEGARCRSCWSLNTVRAFPALFRPAAEAARPAPALDGEAACFDHAGKRAVAACNQCGRFVCDLCKIDFAGQVWCPSCVALGSGGAKVAHADSARTLYDSIALALPTLPVIAFWPVTILTAPATLVFTLINWKKPLSLVRHSRWRFVVGCVVALLELGVWVALLAYWAHSLRAAR